MKRRGEPDLRHRRFAKREAGGRTTRSPGGNLTTILSWDTDRWVRGPSVGGRELEAAGRRRPAAAWGVLL
jgi:hypothetical protein